MLKQSGASNLHSPRTPYSLDLAPMDYHMSGPLKEALRGWRFAIGDGQGHGAYVARSQLKIFFTDGSEGL